MIMEMRLKNHKNFKKKSTFQNIKNISFKNIELKR